MGKWVCLLLMLSLLGGSRGCVAAASYEEKALIYMKGNSSHVFLRGLVGGVSFLLLIKTVASAVWGRFFMVKRNAFSDGPRQKWKVLLNDFLSIICWGELVLFLSYMYILNYRVNSFSKEEYNALFDKSNLFLGYLLPHYLLGTRATRQQRVDYVSIFFSGYLQAYHFFFALFLIPYLFKWLEELQIKRLEAISKAKLHVTAGIKILLGGAFFLAAKWKYLGVFKVMMYAFGSATFLVFVLWAIDLLKWGYNGILEMERIIGKYGHEKGVAQADSAGEDSVATPSLTETNKASDNRSLVVFEKKGKGRKGVVLWAGLLALFIVFGLGSFYFIRKGANN